MLQYRMLHFSTVPAFSAWPYGPYTTCKLLCYSAMLQHQMLQCSTVPASIIPAFDLEFASFCTYLLLWVLQNNLDTYQNPRASNGGINSYAGVLDIIIIAFPCSLNTCYHSTTQFPFSGCTLFQHITSHSFRLIFCWCLSLICSIAASSLWDSWC